MRNHIKAEYRKAVVTVALVALTAGSPVIASEYTQAWDSRDRTQSINLAETGTSELQLRTTTEDPENGVKKLLRKEVLGADGERLGIVQDFVLDTQRSSAVFALVSSGGFLGMGDKLRLVPIHSLQRAEGERFSTQLRRQGWETLPLVNERDLDQGRITLSAQEFDQISRLGDRTWSDAFRGYVSAGQPPSPEHRLVRISDLRDKDIRSGTQEIGEIEDFIVDLNRGSVSAVVETDSEFTGTEQEFLVPLNRLQFGNPRDDFIVTSLTQEDFRRATAQVATRTQDDPNRLSERPIDRTQGTAWSTRPRADAQQPSARTDYSRRDESPSPTGLTDSSSGRGLEPAVNSAARAIRQAWDADPDLARLDLRVSAQNGKLVFEGNVPDARLWERAKDTAEAVVTRLQIDNRINVQPTR